METSTEAPPPLVPHRRGSSARRVRTSRYFQSCCLAHPLSRDVSSSSHVNVTRVTRTKVTSEVADRPCGADVPFRTTDAAAVGANRALLASQRAALHAAPHDAMPSGPH